ncbi:hypothetical protein DL766_002257 [Monosporascus sp. MC13-8B]|uniref:SCP domain-containing protein n=1 Tax=Monosporascus cannonballus TaxID=155416 RepID=A0ABY0HM78_9PEZI|nr:hypothetical protein DL763_004119 [Monosporascus cannonballus]RYO94588.1 hypothetical protein DL762_000480 [Monosporascus cannonballus]RYP35987.1 hypothetical protein DL766_002257 [Monosporascus sp. MC13-8B]
MLLSPSLLTGLVLAAGAIGGVAKLDDAGWFQTGCTYRHLNESGVEEAKQMAARWGAAGNKVPSAGWHVWTAGNVSIWICNCRKSLVRSGAVPVLLEDIESVLRLLRVKCSAPQPTSGWVWFGGSRKSHGKSFSVDHASLWDGAVPSERCPENCVRPWGGSHSHD